MADCGGGYISSRRSSTIARSESRTPTPAAGLPTPGFAPPALSFSTDVPAAARRQSGRPAALNQYPSTLSTVPEYKYPEYPSTPQARP